MGDNGPFAGWKAYLGGVLLMAAGCFMLWWSTRPNQPPFVATFLQAQAMLAIPAGLGVLGLRAKQGRMAQDLAQQGAAAPLQPLPAPAPMVGYGVPAPFAGTYVPARTSSAPIPPPSPTGILERRTQPQAIPPAVPGPPPEPPEAPGGQTP